MLRTTFFLSILYASMAYGGDISDLSGLYYPTMDKGVLQWSCTVGSIGMDGGALSISEQAFQAVDNTCAVQKSVSQGSSVYAKLSCVSEGMGWEGHINLTPTTDGVAITDEHGTINWTRCGS